MEAPEGKEHTLRWIPLVTRKGELYVPEGVPGVYFYWLG
jgi:hypothetical protein